MASMARCLNLDGSMPEARWLDAKGSMARCRWNVWSASMARWRLNGGLDGGLDGALMAPKWLDVGAQLPSPLQSVAYTGGGISFIIKESLIVKRLIVTIKRVAPNSAQY